MNPSNPTAKDIRDIEQLFFEQTKLRTQLVTNPILRMRGLDWQFSDQWMRG